VTIVGHVVSLSLWERVRVRAYGVIPLPYSFSLSQPNEERKERISSLSLAKSLTPALSQRERE
jgi:hypothetical protein